MLQLLRAILGRGPVVDAFAAVRDMTPCDEHGNVRRPAEPPAGVAGDGPAYYSWGCGAGRLAAGREDPGRDHDLGWRRISGMASSF